MPTPSHYLPRLRLFTTAKAYSRYRKGLPVLLIYLIAIFGKPADAASGCETDLYTLFKQYRMQLITAQQFEDLSPYFSENFNAYYRSRMANKSDRDSYIDQYWKNLIRARELMITYSYRQHCAPPKAMLSIIGLLALDGQRRGETLDLWRLDVEYLQETSGWKINAFEYNLARNQNPSGNVTILDNFSVIQSK